MAEETMVVKKSLLRKLLDKAAPEGSLRARAAGAAGNELAPNNYRDRGVSALLTGLVIAFLNRTEAIAKDEALKKHWYALPIGMGVVGYMLHRKGNKYGFLLMALAAFIGFNNFKDRPKTEEEKKKEAETKGFGDGSFLLPQGMLRVMTPDGHEVHIPASQAHLYGIGGTTGDPADIITESIYSRVAA